MLKGAIEVNKLLIIIIIIISKKVFLLKRGYSQKSSAFFTSKQIEGESVLWLRRLLIFVRLIL